MLDFEDSKVTADCGCKVSISYRVSSKPSGLYPKNEIVVTPLISWTYCRAHDEGIKMYQSSLRRHMKKERIKMYESSLRHHMNEEIVIRERVFDDYGDAVIVLDRLKSMVSEYGQASVGELRTMVGLTTTFSDYEYGWRNLSMAGIRLMENGDYVIEFPDVKSLLED